MQGGEKLTAALKRIAEQMGEQHVRVGFLEGATYPDGTPVAAVAFWNEYGNGRAPARPFFRTMLANESTGWALKMQKLYKATKGDGSRILGMMGDDIKGALKQSISTWSDPPNAESTVARKGFNKPLIDTSHMINSVNFEVTNGVEESK